MQLDNEPQEIFDALKECSWIDLDDGVIVIPSWDSNRSNLVEDGTRSNI